MDRNNTQRNNSHETMIKGSAWMTFGSIVSRILGAIYIIPWYAWMGSYGNLANALTAKSYNIYSLFIIISTAGIPGAVAKQVAKYNALNEYRVGRKLFRHGLFLMTIFGIVAAAFMYVASPILAGGDSRQIPILHSLSYAVLIIPILSIMRGYFQGYADMMPSAMSQFVEQLARVAWMLLTAYFIMQVQHGSYLKAVIQSNLAAAVGALFGIGLLMWFLFKRRASLNGLIENSNNAIDVSTGSLFNEIIAQSIPFIIIDSGITFFQLIDQYTFHPMLAMFVHASSDQIESWYALFGLNANKLIMIIISVATAMAVTAIPLLSAAHARRDYRDIANQIENTLELFFFVMIPASLGMAAISKPIYTIFYGYDPLGSSVLYLSAFTAISLGSFTVLMAILQGLSENGLAIKYLVIGLVIKMLVQLPMIKLFKVYGPLIATNIGLALTIWLSLEHLQMKYNYDSNRTARRFVGISCFSIIMFLIVTGVVYFGGIIFSPEKRFSAMILVALGVGVGSIFYILITLKTSLAQKVLGHKIESIALKLHIKV
ncbi:O-antigen/teichoic acid export membrane protein [Lactobacillus colini]|uniref:O-antigen/teichoic acid export membrane protein n=1 Tax=Lactobacillus colini TaxID=1819254 RepID=A0ABS4MF42_9LACO|nr:polysaccharide biosynthesis protein [Lactobacillus colini]MBP2058274.1 O-antigen/teichoic acid export membrane protein [Lactobacillus colini]